MIYTYDVKWVPSDLTWAHRWDVYLKGNPDDEIHYFSIVNRCALWDRTVAGKRVRYTGNEHSLLELLRILCCCAFIPFFYILSLSRVFSFPGCAA